MSARGARRPGIVVKLVLVSLVLLTIPLLTARYVQEMHTFVLKGQQNALQLAAQAVATVLHGREELFRETEGMPFSPWEGRNCSPFPLAGPVQLDGRSRDWPLDGERTCHYESPRPSRAYATGAPSVRLDLTLGQRGGQLYALFQVADDVVRLRPPRHRNLDASDHLRIAIPQPGGGEARYLVTTLADGPVTAYEVGDDWRYAVGLGLPERRIRGVWREAPGGYTVELRLPLAMLPIRQIGLAVGDVDELAGTVSNVVGPSPYDGPEHIRLVLLESPEIDRILRALDLPGARISVVDDRARVRTAIGSVEAAALPGDRERLLASALESQLGSSVSGPITTAASFPIRLDDHVVGAVLIEQSNETILALPRLALERERNAIILACVAIAALFWLFAWRLAWRIRRLRDDAAHAIDDEGRVRKLELEAGRHAGDEIGDLSRTVSGLLARLSHYTSFLERIPTTLRHELSNPLNTLSTSLQNLVIEHPELDDSKYLQSAERGVARIGAIVESLTEAASLEQALRDDEPEPVDLADLVTRYVENFAAGCPERRFRLAGVHEPIRILASGFRIEQILDKLFDNAVAFSPADAEITLELVCKAKDDGARVELRVSNEGPLIPDEIRRRLFDGNLSTRTPPDVERTSMGIGLYVVRVITEQLAGTIRAQDREDRRGPLFVIDLPVLESKSAFE